MSSPMAWWNSMSARGCGHGLLKLPRWLSCKVSGLPEGARQMRFLHWDRLSSLCPHSLVVELGGGPCIPGPWLPSLCRLG